MLLLNLLVGDKPGILKLKKIKAPDGLNIIESIAAKDYRTFAMFLLDDDNGNKVDMIKKSNPNADVPGVVEAIINKWLDVPDPVPTYSHFVECLKDADMGALWLHMKSLMAEGILLQHMLIVLTPSSLAPAATSSQATSQPPPPAAATAATATPPEVPDDELGET